MSTNTFIHLTLIFYFSAQYSCQKTYDSKKVFQSYSSEQLQELVNEYLTDKEYILGAIVLVNINKKENYYATSGYCQ